MGLNPGVSSVGLMIIAIVPLMLIHGNLLAVL